MGILGEADLVVMFADLAEAGATVAVMHEGTTVDGLLDESAVEIFGDNAPPVIATDESVVVIMSQLPGLEAGDAITVDGVAKKVLKVLPYGDGAIGQVALSETE